MKITVSDYFPIGKETYTIDLDRRFEGYERGDIKWDFSGKGNHYLHTDTTPEYRKYSPAPTSEQCDTVAGLFSGRITFDGLKLAPGRLL